MGKEKQHLLISCLDHGNMRMKHLYFTHFQILMFFTSIEWKGLKDYLLKKTNLKSPENCIFGSLVGGVGYKPGTDFQNSMI